MKFWVRINGLQEGPMEIDQMKDYNITPTTYVWCAGMKDWAYARDVEDLKDIIVSENVKAAEVASNNESSETEPIKEEILATENTDDCSTESEPSISEIETPQAQQPCEATTVEQPEPQPAKEERPCPPNNLVWAILATVFCCQISGLIAIVFAAQVSNKYYCEGYEEAKKYSDRAGLWCIISIVLAILSYSIFMPFALLAPLL